MTEPTTINEFAERYNMDVGVVMLGVIKYLVADPRDINSAVRNVLNTATDDEIIEALETIADDLRASGTREVIA